MNFSNGQPGSCVAVNGGIESSQSSSKRSLKINKSLMCLERHDGG